MRVPTPRRLSPRSLLVAVFLAAAVALSPARLDAAVLTWNATLSGAQEIPANVSTATGSGTVQYDTVANTLAIDVDWSGLTGDGIQAHIHCCVVTPPGNVGIALDLWLLSDPSRPPTGTYSAFYDLDVDNPFRATFVTANGGTTASAFAALMAAMDAGDGRAYFNIHTVEFPGGEIRGNIAVPEPASLWLLVGGLGAAMLRRRSSRGRT